MAIELFDKPRHTSSTQSGYKTKPSVQDEPCVCDIEIYGGQVESKNTAFAYGSQNKRPSSLEACKVAQIYHEIMKFPHGYRNKPGERGVRLSGGELQRLAIARVILRRSKIVVLDEATSAVGSETESLIQKALGTLSAGRTVFMIAHWGIVGPGGPLVDDFFFPWSPGSEHS
ncbi:hypothetical protein E4U58_001625 [Claviceps cyperi]|nr:hypothetical protein E4U58_001625 [Claviceps cyperi]